jgi:hypothetical protein
MKSWLAVGLFMMSAGAFAADKTPAKTPSTSTTPPASTKASEPTKLSVEEDAAEQKDPKHKEVDTKSNDSDKKPNL